MKTRSLSLFMVIIFMVIVVTSASYAYFKASVLVDGSINADITTIGTNYAFTAMPDKDISLNIDTSSLTEENIGTNQASNSTIKVALLAGSDDKIVNCHYNINFVWDGNEYHKTHSLPVKINEESEEEIAYELSLQAKSTIDNEETSMALKETNIDDFSWKSGEKDDKKIATIITGAEISNNSANIPTIVTWDFSLKFYVLPTPQNSLIGKNYSAHLVVSDVRCS